MKRRAGRTKTSRANPTGLTAYRGRGLFITATGTDVGKTTVTAAITQAMRELGIHVGLCKPVASGCSKRADRGNDPVAPLTDDDLWCSDAAIGAAAAGIDASNEEVLRYLSPVRFAAPIAPAAAARIEKRQADWNRVKAAFAYWSKHSDVLLVEGAGGWFVPIDDRDTMIADVAAALKLPVLVVAQATLGTINQTLLTVAAIRSRGLDVAGLVINRVPPQEKRDQAVISNLKELPRLCGTRLWAALPEVTDPAANHGAFATVLRPAVKAWLGKRRQAKRG